MPAPNEKPHKNGGNEDSESDYDSTHDALYEIASGIANVLEKDKVVDAVANWVNAHASLKPKEHDKRWSAFVIGQVFGLIIFVGILFGGWRHIIGPEATTGLLGALIGYWYGQREKQK